MTGGAGRAIRLVGGALIIRRTARLLRRRLNRASRRWMRLGSGRLGRVMWVLCPLG